MTGLVDDTPGDALHPTDAESGSFAGIAPASAPMIIVVQLVGAVIAHGLVRLFHPHDHSEDAT